MGFWLELELQQYDSNGDVLKMFLPENIYKYEEYKDGIKTFIAVYDQYDPDGKTLIMAIDKEWYDSKFSYEGF